MKDKHMKLSGIVDISIIKSTIRGKRKVRISVGDYMYFDSPDLTILSANITKHMLKERLENDSTEHTLLSKKGVKKIK